MTVRELIELLEEMPQDLPVCLEGQEITEAVLRDEVYFTAEFQYKDGEIIKLY